MNVTTAFVRGRRTGWCKRIKIWSLLVAAILITVGCGRPTPPAGWETSFDSAEGWNLSSDPVADVSVMQGALNVHVIAPGQIAWAASEAEWQDCRVSVEATQVAGPADNEYGILIRMAQDDSFTAFSISGDGYSRVALYQDGSWSVIGPDWTPTPAINEGAATNQLEIVAEGTQLVFRVNGELVRQVEAGEARAGAIGLYAGAFSEGDVVVAFDNLVVEPLP